MSLIYIDGQPYIVGQRCHGCRGSGTSQWTGIGAPQPHGPCRGTGVFFLPEVTECGDQAVHHPESTTPCSRRACAAVGFVPDPDAEPIRVLGDYESARRGEDVFVFRNGYGWHLGDVSDGTSRTTPIDSLPADAAALIKAVPK